jgi:drug/metabolite transporter (DMT)-like permease
VAAVLLGLLIAAAFGSGDFVGGRASAAASTATVLLISQACSVAGALVLAFVVSARVAPHDVVYGAVAGATNVVGLALLYHALARHAAGVVAPITAVVGSAVPIVWGLAHGERPSALVLVGITMAVVAGALIAREPGETSGITMARGVPEAVAAGIALGSSLVLYSETSEASGQWPLLVARICALALAGIAVAWLARRGPVTFPRGAGRGLAIAAGVFDVTATALLLVAVRHELLSIVAPVISLAPAFTVLLAWRLTGERLHALQRAGLIVALAGLVLVAIG